jgi:putative Ca2+/H+ antiporter (TMEM165/GDT1 family)
MPLQPASQSSNSVLPAASEDSAVHISEALVESELPSGLQPDLQLESPQTDRTDLKVFLSTFVTIFLAELGDKTQLTTLLLTAKSHAPWVVFAGAGTALVTTSLLGVWLGCWLAQRISAKTLETAAGVLLLLISAQLFWEVFHL